MHWRRMNVVDACHFPIEFGDTDSIYVRLRISIMPLCEHLFFFSCNEKKKTLTQMKWLYI